MPFDIYRASAPVFVTAMGNMKAWLDQAAAAKPEAELFDAKLADDMKPLPAQYQFASDSAKNAIGRLIGGDAPSMPDTEASFADLRARCDKTIAYIESVDPQAFADSASREVVMKFPNGTGYRFTGADYLTRFALPNFYFHVSMAYAIFRAQGVPLGKPDFLRHLGAPIEL
jgi:hypothetical protein